MLNFAEPTFQTSIAHRHGLNTAIGYVVRRTFLREPQRLHEDVATFTEAEHGWYAYSAALELAWKVREEDGHYAVVDTLHRCGCRSAG